MKALPDLLNIAPMSLWADGLLPARHHTPQTHNHPHELWMPAAFGLRESRYQPIYYRVNGETGRCVRSFNPRKSSTT